MKKDEVPTAERSKFDIRHKEALTLCLREYFQLFFPDIADKIAFETAIFMDKELIALFGGDESDQHKITDALILVEITMDSAPELIMIHWEQQHKKPKVFDEQDQSRNRQAFEERMFHYFCGIYFKHRRLVLPIAMFTDSAKWRKSVKNTFKLALPGYPIVEYTYHIIKLKHIKAEEFEAKMADNILAAAYLPLTNYPKEKRPEIKAKAMNRIAKDLPGPKQATLYSLVNECIRLDDDEEKRYQKLINSDEEVKMLQSVEEVGIEKGIEIGIDKGELIGKIVLAQEILEEMLYSRESLKNMDIDELLVLWSQMQKKMKLRH